MGLLSDLKMGLGLQERDADYYERTAKTIGRNDGAAAEARYRGGRAFTEQPKQAGLLSMMGSGDRATRKFGYTDASGNRVGALRDMFDGGGAGRSGQQFEGGLLAMLANALGIKPIGYQQPTATATPTPTPTNTASANQTTLTAKPNWAKAQPGIALGGQDPRFSNAALSFGGNAGSIDPTSLPLSFGSLVAQQPNIYSGRGSYGMPEQPMIYSGRGSYGMPWGQNPLTQSTSNIRGTGTGGGGYGFPAVGTYTF